jgi:DNA-binding NtrC family response regulator
MNARAKVLVVDDDAIVRFAHLRTLAGTNCKVELALNGIEALKVMEHSPFDVVLLDQRMPGMDGMEVLKTIKEKWPESEVIMITGYPTLELAKQAAKLGAYDYLAKPLDPDEVINATSGAMMHKKWALRIDEQSQCAGNA